MPFMEREVSRQVSSMARARGSPKPGMACMQAARLTAKPYAQGKENRGGGEEGEQPHC